MWTVVSGGFFFFYACTNIIFCWVKGELRRLWTLLSFTSTFCLMLVIRVCLFSASCSVSTNVRFVASMLFVWLSPGILKRVLTFLCQRELEMEFVRIYHHYCQTRAGGEVSEISYSHCSVNLPSDVFIAQFAHKREGPMAMVLDASKGLRLLWLHHPCSNHMGIFNMVLHYAISLLTRAIRVICGEIGVFFFPIDSVCNY